MKRILVIDDDARCRELYCNTLSHAGLEVCAAESSEAALTLVQRDPPAMIVSDVRLPGKSGIELLQEIRVTHPDLPCLLVTAHADVRQAVNALKLGAVDYLPKPVDLDELLAAVTDTLGVAAPHPVELPAGVLDGIVAESPGMRAVLRDALRVAQADTTVLITGESGTGKDVLANFIHRQSRRAKEAFVAVNCAAVPETLLASELFGHERGAFTGAVTSRPGRFREAHKGTLFLDEIGDMPLNVQATLLRAIETGRATPVGGTGEVDYDVRFIAATNRDLDKDIVAGRFRQDLYFRLNVIALQAPPLRQRPEDIPPLTRFFLTKKGGEPKRLSAAAARLVQRYTWPGNVRELANALERGRVLASGEVILPEHLPPSVRSEPPALPPKSEAPQSQVLALDQVERTSIENALRQTNGNRTKAAELLKISRRALIYKLKDYGL